MLKINRLADYATIIVVYLAQQSGKLSTTKAIAKATHLAEPTVSKILKKLTHSGFLVSELGVQGGYALKRAASEISLVQILEAMEGPLALTECNRQDSDCALEPYCHVSEHWQVIHQVVYQALDQIKLSTLAKHNHDHQAVTSQTHTLKHNHTLKDVG